MSHGPAQALLPQSEKMTEAWRAAVLVYRTCLREGHFEHISYHNARAQLWRLMPELTYDEAAEAATQAIYFMSWKFPAWLWSGTSGLPPRPKMPFTPPHIINDPVSLARLRRAGLL